MVLTEFKLKIKSLLRLIFFSEQKLKLQGRLRKKISLPWKPNLILTYITYVKSTYRIFSNSSNLSYRYTYLHGVAVNKCTYIQCTISSCKTITYQLLTGKLFLYIRFVRETNAFL